jgi:hypothetical protein
MNERRRFIKGEKHHTASQNRIVRANNKPRRAAEESPQVNWPPNTPGMRHRQGWHPPGAQEESSSNLVEMATRGYPTHPCHLAPVSDLPPEILRKYPEREH